MLRSYNWKLVGEDKKKIIFIRTKIESRLPHIDEYFADPEPVRNVMTDVFIIKKNSRALYNSQ